MLIIQGFAEPSPITQGFSQAPAPAGGTAGGGAADPLRRFASITYRYLGGRSGQPEPSSMPAGPILVRYFDEHDQIQVDVMQVVEQDAEPGPGITINPGAVSWGQVVAWCPLAELDL